MKTGIQPPKISIFKSLPQSVRTAGFFYLGFAVLLFIVTIFPFSTAQTVAGEVNGVLEDEDLLAFSNTLPSSWHGFLNESGMASKALNKIEEVKLREAYINQHKFEWAFFSSCVTLPEAGSEKLLIRLGTRWKQILENTGLEITDLKWGYSGKDQFWMKILTTVRYSSDEDHFSFPLAQFTFIQPLKKPEGNFDKLKGILPQPTPRVALEQPQLKIPELKPTPPPIPKPSLPPVKPVAPFMKPKARVSIIIDDVGFVKEPADRMLEVPTRLTWAFLPLSPYGRYYEEAATKRGFEVILHLPMEPFNAAENPGPGTIKREWDESEIIRQLDQDLSSVPGVKGINNHEGSAGTSDKRLMEILMREFKQRNLFFIDSYTSNQSVAQQVARQYNVPFARRQVFIDHFESYDAKVKALRELIKLALKYGEAVGIAHVRNGTAEAIMEVLPEFAQAGVEIVPVSQLVK